MFTCAAPSLDTSCEGSHPILLLLSANRGSWMECNTFSCPCRSSALVWGDRSSLELKKNYVWESAEYILYLPARRSSLSIIDCFWSTIGDSSCDRTFILLLILSHLQVGSRSTSENTVRRSFPLSFAIRIVISADFRKRPSNLFLKFFIKHFYHRIQLDQDHRWYSL